MKYVLGAILWIFLGVFSLSAEVSLLSVTDEDKHTRKEDFYHTFEYVVGAPGVKQGGKCQATRIAPHWFVTAAHCVVELCEKSCTLTMDLLSGSVSAWAEGKHTAQKPTVFVYPQYSGDDLDIQYDLALIYLDLYKAPKTYYRRPTKKGEPYVVIPQREFSAKLANDRAAQRAYRRVFNPALPPIAIFDNFNQVLKRDMSVVSIFNGIRDVKQDPYAVYYVKELGYAYTQNFGVRKGMSGSGVMTNTGELLGIISTIVEKGAYSKNKKGKYEDLFMFPVFNADLVEFMKETMGNDFNKVSQKEAYPYLTQKTGKDFSSVLRVKKKK